MLQEPDRQPVFEDQMETILSQRPDGKKKLKEWKRERKNLKALVEKHPDLLLDALDAAYLAGLEKV